jgi:hypothetical protein
MKQISLTFFIIVGCFNLAYGQKKEEINFSDPLQIDSSEYFLIPKLIDNDNQQAYGKGKGYLPWGNYSDILFYNSATNQTKKLFNGQLALINPFYLRRYYYDYAKEKETPANILPNQIVYLARTDNFNGDNGLDTDDPVYLYISTKKGDNLKQITPKGFHVVSWSISKDNKMILVKGQNDKNGNKKFGNGDDELYYRIDLNADISKIQCYQINL